MIVDRLDNAGLYTSLGPRIAQAFEFLSRKDLASLPKGRNDIDSDQVYAMVQSYQPRPLDKIIWESHRKYIDVQYIVRGRERMGYVHLDAVKKVTSPYDAKNDCALYEADGDLITYTAGMFAIFGPQDVHAPGLAPANGAGGEVQKIVVKVAV